MKNRHGKFRDSKTEIIIFPHHQEDPEFSPIMTKGCTLKEVPYFEIFALEPRWKLYLGSIAKDVNKIIISLYHTQKEHDSSCNALFLQKKKDRPDRK